MCCKYMIFCILVKKKSIVCLYVLNKFGGKKLISEIDVI